MLAALAVVARRPWWTGLEVTSFETRFCYAPYVVRAEMRNSLEAPAESTLEAAREDLRVIRWRIFHNVDTVVSKCRFCSAGDEEPRGLELQVRVEIAVPLTPRAP